MFLHVVLFSGNFSLDSTLVCKSKINEIVKSKDKKDLIFDELKKHVYEKFTIRVKNVQMVLSDDENWKKDLSQLNTVRHLLFPVEIVIVISHCVIADHRFPQLMIDGDLKLNFSLSKI